jgi:hypothetical protein
MSTSRFLIKSITISFFIFVIITSCNRNEKNQIDSSQPNLLLIITDDQGYSDFGIYGVNNEVNTPHLDQLAKSGIRFSNAYVTMSI